MRNLVIVLESMQECLKNTDFGKAKDAQIQKLIYGQGYQAPESTAYWELTGETIIQELGGLAEITQERGYINALAVWCAKTPLQVLDIMREGGLSIKEEAQAQAKIDTEDWPHEIIEVDSYDSLDS